MWYFMHESLNILLVSSFISFTCPPFFKVTVSLTASHLILFVYSSLHPVDYFVHHICGIALDFLTTNYFSSSSLPSFFTDTLYDY